MFAAFYEIFQVIMLLGLVGIIFTVSTQQLKKNQNFEYNQWFTTQSLVKEGVNCSVFCGM